MPEERFVSYVRVSTRRQQRSGLGLEAQTEIIRGYAGRRGGRLVGAFMEVTKAASESARVLQQQPALAAALDVCRAEHATLLVARLDRLARNVAFLAELVENGPNFVVVELDDVSAMALAVYAALAEEERRRIAARVRPSADRKARAAVAYAETLRPAVEDAIRDGSRTYADIARHLNAQGLATSWGNPWSLNSTGDLMRRLNGTYDPKHIPGRRSTGPRVRPDAADAHDRAVYPEIVAILAAECTSLSGIARELTRRGWRTWKGCAWHPVAVRRVLDRMEPER
jgi:DNA invertase Pin-like site-specific DNA recombinase